MPLAPGDAMFLLGERRAGCTRFQRTRNERPNNSQLVAPRRNVIQGAHDPQADRYIRRGLVADLLKCRIQKAFGPNPWNNDPHHVRGAQSSETGVLRLTNRIRIRPS
jgi:hypothetical protein